MDTEGVTREEIAERLKVSQSYINNHILKSVKKVDNDSYRPYFDSFELREHLASQATISRQTKRIDVEKEIRRYMRSSSDSNRPDIKEFLGNIPDMKKLAVSRNNIPVEPLAPIDFWDLNLIFPKAYTREKDGDVLNPELCYRDMFKAGAIKIQLGKQKTMFFIPGNRSLQEVLATPIDDPKSFLVPADWRPFYKGLVLVEAEDPADTEKAGDKGKDFLLGVMAEKERTAYSLFYMGLTITQVIQVTELPRDTVVEMRNAYSKNKTQIIDKYGLGKKRDGNGR